MIIRRPTLFAAIGFAAATAATLLALSLDSDDKVELQPMAPAPANDQDSDLPAIHIVRIGDHGDAMIAGRAASGGPVEIFDASSDPARSLGHAVADISGEWVFVPDIPLTKGVWQLFPSSSIADAASVDSHTSVVIAVPSQSSEGVLATTLLPGGGGHVLLPVASDASPEGPIGVHMIEQEGGGRIMVDGHAQAGNVVHFYMDNRLAGRARTAESGEWRLSAKSPRQGPHTIRADQVDERGMVMARQELKWQAESAHPIMDGKRLEARPNGQSWTIIRQRPNGKDIRTEVYLPDPSRIRDPKLLFPGQVTSVPAP